MTNVLLNQRRRAMHPLPPVTDVRVFQGRTSMGVRGINLGKRQGSREATRTF